LTFIYLWPLGSGESWFLSILLLEDRWLLNGPFLAGINDDIRVLMDEADEGLWQEAGFDGLGKLSHNIKPSYTNSPALLAHPLSRGIGNTPTFSNYLPGLSESLPELQQHTIGGSPSIEDRGGGFSGYRRKVDSTALLPRKYH
jgi:hypothetical protein